MNPPPFLPNQMPSPEEQEKIKEKVKKIKDKAEKFKEKILKTHKKQILGVALLPPKKEESTPKGIPADPLKKDKQKINVLILLDDSKSEFQPDFKLRDKIFKELEKTDNEIYPEVYTVSEVKETLFDSKYEILQMIAMSAILYDPMDVLGALKISEVHKSMVLQKFEKYIVSYVAAGSLFRGEKSNDIDVYVVIDDPDVRRMTRVELRDKLRSLIISQGFEAAAITGVKKDFHVQIYILTDFWESIKDAHPVIFTLLRDGVPIYDRGVFTPWRLLLNMGRIRPSPEAIDMQMDMGEKLLERAKKKLLMIAGEDLYYGILNPSQAALMLYGVSPPTPKETVKLLEEVFVKKEKILEQKYVDTLEKIRVFFKKIEHGKVKEIKGAEIDQLLIDAEDYLKRIKKLFKQIERKTEKESFTELYKNLEKSIGDILKTEGIKYTKLELGFKKFCQKENLPETLVNNLKSFVNANKDFKAKKLIKAESDKIKREIRTFLRAVVEHSQRKKFLGVERAKLKFKNKDKFGEVLLLKDQAFIIKDLKQKDKIKKAVIEKGRLKEVKDSTRDELDKTLLDVEVPQSISLTPGLFEDLKKIVGKDIELLL
ncbi:hypothetical protein HOG16_01905 [Candidatus Woesearchaeota archaeon]|nr:hypothetical protein [Candidatus Woesearchaeota archaeon]